MVTSDKMDKTISILIERRVRHPLYDKVIRKFTKVMVHDEENLAKEGDKVEIAETRPLSKKKRWMLVRVVEAKEKIE